jgi:hypothetical protein
MNNNSNSLEEYNNKMQIVYNVLKFDYLVQVAVNELNKLNEIKEIKEIKEIEPSRKRQRKH